LFEQICQEAEDGQPWAMPARAAGHK